MPAARWSHARDLAATAVPPLPPCRLGLQEALGLGLAGDLLARTDLPPFPTAAMDGWAVRGVGPWRVVGEVLAGGEWSAGAAPLAEGTAVRIATGATMPSGADAVLRREHGRLVSNALLRREAPGPGPDAVAPGTDLRPRGGECRVGDVVATAGSRVTPALLGLAAAAGHDDLPVHARPRVDVLVLGDELLDAGPATGGRVRDALGPMLPGWLAALGAAPGQPRRVPDTVAALDDALDGAPDGDHGDLVVTTGSTARGPVDHLHAVLASRSARLVVDGVAVRPGHPMVLALLPDGRPLIGLPGNPLAAVSGLLTLGAPLLGALLGLAPRALPQRLLAEAISGHPTDTRLVPLSGDRPVRHVGPAMLRGLVAADGMAVVPPGGCPAGGAVEVLPLPW